MKSAGRIRRISYPRKGKNNEEKSYSYSLGQLVNIGTRNATIVDFVFSRSENGNRDMCRIYIAADGVKFPWFDLVNQSDLKLEYDFEFFNFKDS